MRKIGRSGQCVHCFFEKFVNKDLFHKDLFFLFLSISRSVSVKLVKYKRTVTRCVSSLLWFTQLFMFFTLNYPLNFRHFSLLLTLCFLMLKRRLFSYFRFHVRWTYMFVICLNCFCLFNFMIRDIRKQEYSKLVIYMYHDVSYALRVIVSWKLFQYWRQLLQKYN